VSLGRPDEGPGVAVVYSDVLFDGRDRFGDAAKHPAAQPPSSDVAKETLDHVQPRGRGRSEVDVKAGMTREPAANLGVFGRLDLTLLITAPHQGVFGRIQIQPHDLSELLDKTGVARDLEALDSMGLQSVLVPHAQNSRVAHAQLVRQTARTPMGRIARSGQSRASNDLGLVDLRGATASGQFCNLVPPATRSLLEPTSARWSGPIVPGAATNCVPRCSTESLSLFSSPPPAPILA
jgi:hypothetical protein